MGIDPTYFNGRQPVISGTTQVAIGMNSPCAGSTSTGSFYGTTENCNDFAMFYRGYIYAYATGFYTFTIPTAVDDRLFVWVGPYAQSGYTGSNYNLETSYVDRNPLSTLSYSYFATAGQYVPYLAMFAQVTGLYYYYLEITGPDGTTLMAADGKTAISKYLVLAPC